MPRVLAWLTLAVTAMLLIHPAPALAEDRALVVTSGAATYGDPVPGSVLSTGTGTWAAPQPDGFEYVWLRDGVPMPAATEPQYTVEPADIGHQIAVTVTGTKAGFTPASFTSDAVTIRKVGSSLRLDVRRAHSPGKQRLVWTAITIVTTERPWPTDGGTVTAYKVKDGRLKELGAGPMARNAAFVRLPWKRPPPGRTRVVVCFAGSEVVEESCSPFDVVRRPRGHDERH